MTPTSPLSLFREASFGHGRLAVLNHTHAHWTWQRNDDSDSTIGDEVWLESLSGSDKCNAVQSTAAPPAPVNDEL